jgi:spore coat protein H
MLLLARASAAPPSLRQDKSDDFFASGVIPNLRIEIAPTNMASLRRDERTYVRATVREGDRVYEEVGIHLKGAAGSHQPIEQKPALTLNFDKFRDGQKFHDIDKLHLNNSVQDRSFMTEALCSEMFLAAGVPTARTTHARVWLNGRDLGLYVLKEGYDRTFLKRHFRNTKGNLYDGGFLQEITARLQRDDGENDVKNYSDLRAVAAAAREKDFSKRMGRLEQVLDVDRFIAFTALEILTEHWDGYALKKNNYRIYHDPESGRCVFIPHGMDQMFWRADRPLIPNELEGMVARGVLETTEGRQRYRRCVSNLASNIFTTEKLTEHIERLYARLHPVLQSMGGGHAREHDSEVQKLRRQVQQRVKRVDEMLAEPAPEPIDFDANGVAKLTHWQPFDLKSSGKLDQVELDGRPMFHIAAGTTERCSASWRSATLLKPGRYVFEARLRTTGIVPLTENPSRGLGAGIRISRARVTRSNGFVGDNDWVKVEYEISIEDETGEPIFVCELRAAQGEVWFDPSSLHVRKVK